MQRGRSARHSDAAGRGRTMPQSATAADRLIRGHLPFAPHWAPLEFDHSPHRPV
jgi:hypothetical protein